MDPSAFDALSRTLVAGGTRRRLLGRLGTLLPAVGLGIVLGEDAEARGRSHGRNRGHRPGRRKNNRKGLRSRRKGTRGSDPCGGTCGINETCCGSGANAQCCPAESSICCGASHNCCPTDRAICCGSGGEAHCCPTDSHYCWPNEDGDGAACLECPNGNCHV
jgi:hypothetical protein